MGKAFPEPLEDIALVLQHGGVIAYPTEGVFGLGCDPFNAKAVEKLLEIKHRDPSKGLILIAANWQQIEPLVSPIHPPALARVLESWPGAITWLFPASTLVPKWIRGKHNSVAVRIPDHTLARKICEAFSGPIVSTSANLEGYPAIRNLDTLKMLFAKKVDLIVSGHVGNRLKPSEIRDAITGEVLREG